LTTSATRKDASDCAGSNISSTSSPMRVSVSAISSTLAFVSRCSFSQASVNFMCLYRVFELRRSRQAAGEGGHQQRLEAVMLQPPKVGGEEGAQVGHAVFQHGDAVDPHAEGEALVALRVEADIGEHVRMHHAAAQDLEPAVALADPDLVTDLGVTDIHL